MTNDCSSVFQRRIVYQVAFDLVQSETLKSYSHTLKLMRNHSF